MLLEGEDLVVDRRAGDGAHRRRACARERAVAAPRRGYADPLELDERSAPRHAGPCGRGARGRHDGQRARRRACWRRARCWRSCRASARCCAVSRCCCPTSPPGGAGRSAERDACARQPRALMVAPRCRRAALRRLTARGLGGVSRSDAGRAWPRLIGCDGALLVGRRPSRCPRRRPGRRAAGAAPDEHARVPGPHPIRLAGHARRLSRASAGRGCRRHCHAARRLGGRCLGGQRQSGGRRSACCPPRGALCPPATTARCQPRGRQPVLAGPLCGTRRGHDAPAARLSHALAERPTPTTPLWPGDGIPRLAGGGRGRAIPAALRRSLRRDTAPPRCATAFPSTAGWRWQRPRRYRRALAGRCHPATMPRAPWACCCARSPAFPVWCTKTCIASPAGGS
jgi:hypothetical protein